MKTDELKKQWHAPFCSAMRLELREDKDYLTFQNEYNLSSKPLQMDLLIIKKPKEIQLTNELGKLFRGHNIIEYKSPDYALDVDTYFKVLGYACLYKSLDDHKETIHPEDITITLVREGYPRELMKYLADNGCEIKQEYPGIYYVTKTAFFPVQIVTSKALNPELHTWLVSLTRNMKAEQAENLLLHVSALQGKPEWNHADSILDLAIKANKEIFHIVKEENPVCEALLELMKPEMDAAVEKAVEEAVENTTLETKFDGVKGAMEVFGSSLETACKAMKLSVEDYWKIKEKRDFSN